MQRDIEMRTSDGEDAVAIFTQKVFNVEAQVQQERKKSGKEWMGHGYEVFEGVEGKHLCDYMEVDRREQCSNALNGQLQQGMAAAVGSLANKMIQKDLKFRSEGSDNLRVDSEFAEMQNVKTLFIDEGLDISGKALHESVVDYFSKAQRDRIIAFVCFIGAIMVLAAVMKTWGIRHLKRNFMTTTAIVGLIPAQWIPNPKETGA